MNNTKDWKLERHDRQRLMVWHMMIIINYRNEALCDWDCDLQFSVAKVVFFFFLFNKGSLFLENSYEAPVETKIFFFQNA